MRPLIRLQCYEGLDVNSAVYEWDYPRQMLAIRMLEAKGKAAGADTKSIFTEEFLIRRPLLAALSSEGKKAPVLLIDEVDRADEEFEAFLLEILSDFAVTIPEIGTIRAEHPAEGDHHQQSDPRSARRAQASLPLPLDRLPDRLSGSSQSSSCVSPACQALWPARSSTSFSDFGEPTSLKCPGLRKRSTGRPRWSR
jgi:hypothetical protein